MIFEERYDSRDDPFEGDRELCLRRVPEGARILNARATVKPVDATGGVDPFAETLCFDGLTGEWGTTKTKQESADSIPGWIEVDFHTRRKLARVRGSQLAKASLQVDLGGTLVEINDKGAFLEPGGTRYTLPGDDSALPGLTVFRFRMTSSGARSPDVTTVTVRSLPSNVSLRLGGLQPFWIHPGELAVDKTTADFAEVLQAFLADAEVENGYYAVPLTLHSDTLARLELELRVEYVCERTVLPEGVDEVALPFDLGGVPQTGDGVLKVSLPPGAVVRAAAGRAVGAFEDTRIVHGPVGDVASTEIVEISDSVTQAQPIALKTATAASAVDLWVAAASRTVRLQLDLRNDADGKPGTASLLTSPVELALDRETTGRPTWVSAALLAEVQFEERQSAVYWLVVQGLEGTAGWVAEAATAGTAGMESTRDGGLSWRRTTLPESGGPAAALFRLRRRPPRFEMPVELRVGTDPAAKPVSFERFASQGRIDLSLDFPEIASKINDYVTHVATAAPESEHLANGDFERWLREGDALGEPSAIACGAERYPMAVRVSPDGQWAFAMSPTLHGGGTEEVFLQVIDLCCERVSGEILLGGTMDPENTLPPKGLAIHPDGTRAYAVIGSELHVIDLADQRHLGSVAQDGVAERNEPISLKCLAVSPDGRHLHIGFSRGDQPVLAKVDTKELENASLNGAGELESLFVIEDTLLEGPRLSTEISDLAVSPDGARIYAVVVNHKETSAESHLYTLDESAFGPVEQALRVGTSSTAIALSRDGTTALVADEGLVADGENGHARIEPSVSIVDLGRLRILDTLNITGRPRAVASEPGGSRGFVAADTGGSSAKRGLSFIDLERRQRVSIDTATTDFHDVVVTPQGDRVVAIGVDTPQEHRVVAIEVDSKCLTRRVFTLPLGKLLPEEWEPTGLVRPFCLPEPALHRVATLGDIPNEGSALSSGPAGLSQVVPVTPSFAYELSFQGLASDEGTVAEILWLSGECGLIETNSLPLRLWKPDTPVTPFPHRLRAIAPATAAQAEVRFTARDGAAIVDRVSLRATTETVANAELRLAAEGVPEGWTLEPSNATGLVVAPSGDSDVDGEGLRLVNAGGETISLVQSVNAEGGGAFELKLRGRNLGHGPSAPTGRLEVRWLGTDGATVGAATSLTIEPACLDRLAAAGTVPSDATRADISLVLPAGAEREIRGVSLRFPETVRVPLTFLSQAPGNLAVSDWRVSYDLPEAPPPPVPSSGLCSPTRPDRRPGEQPADCCHCPWCGCEGTMKDATPRVTEADRPVLVGSCAKCHGRLIRYGGQLVPGAPRLETPRLPRLRRRVSSAIACRPERAEPPPIQSLFGGRASRDEAVSSPEPSKKDPIPLTRISGIGEKRAGQLRAMGIDSVEKLAIAESDKLSEKLRGVNEQLADNLINQAKKQCQSLS